MANDRGGIGELKLAGRRRLLLTWAAGGQALSEGSIQN